MSRNARVLQSGVCEVTQEYKGSTHAGIDIVKKGYMLDNIVAHSDGTVVEVISNCNINTSGDGRYNSPYRDSNNPGNMVKIDHGNGYMTRYLHLTYNTINVSVGQRISKGQVLGYMGNTGYSFGGHLHFEVWKDGNRIDPTEYLEKDLYNATLTEAKKAIDEIAYDVIEGKYGNYPERKARLEAEGYNYSEVQTRVNELVNKVVYLSNSNYTGVSIVDALNQIGVNSSFGYRTKLANANDIANYCGTAEQNIQMLEMLKNGTLKSV